MTSSLKQIVRLAVACLGACGLSSCGFIQVAHDVSLDEAMKMPPFEATVDNVQISHPWFLYHGVDIWLTRVDSGKHLNLDICPANDFVVGFARSLHEGATYSFPAVFGEYVNSTPTNFTKAYDTELRIIPVKDHSKKVDRALKFYVAHFSTDTTNHFYVGVTQLDRTEPLTASIYWKEARLLMDYEELEDNAPEGAEIFALSHQVKLDRDTVDTAEDIAGSTYLETHRQWIEQMEQCISKGNLYVVTLEQATNRFPNADRSKIDDE